MRSSAQDAEPEWKQLLHLGEQLVRLEDAQAQFRLIEETAALLLGGRAVCVPCAPFYPLPGEAPDAALADAPASPLTAFVLTHRQPAGQKKKRTAPLALEDAGAVRAVAFPLVANANLLGVLEFSRPTPLTAQEINLLEGLAAHSAVSLELYRQEAIKDWRNGQLNLVREVSAEITGLLDVDLVCRRVTQLIQETFHYYYVALFTLSHEGDAAIFRAAAFPPGMAAPSPDARIPLGLGLVGSAAKERASLYAADVDSEPRYRVMDGLPGTRSEICLPIKADNELLAILDVQSDRVNGFHETDILVLSTLADSVALALQNARLYEDVQARAGQISTIIEVSHALNAILDFDQLLSEVVSIIQKRFGYPYVHIFSVHSGRRLVIYLAGSGERSQAMHHQEITYNLDSPQGIIPYVARSGRSYFTNDVASDPRYRPSEMPPHNTRGELAVPLLSGGEVIGVLDVQSSEENAFSEAARQLFEALAAAIAIAFRNASLYRSEKWRGQVADSFRDVATQISSGAELRDLLANILEKLHANLPCEASALWLVEEELGKRGGDATSRLHLAASRGIEPELLDAARREAPETFASLEVVFQAAQPIIRTRGDPPGPLGYAMGYDPNYSSVVTPLRAGNRPLGVLALAHPTFGRYGSEAQSLTATFAGYAAVAIQNARLYAEAQEQAWVSTMLVQVAEASQTTLSIDDLLATMLRMTRLLVGVRKCAFLIREEKQPTYDLRAWYGFEPGGDEQVQIPVTAPAMVRLAGTLGPLYIDDPLVELGLRELELPEDSGTILLLPLMVRGDLTGALAVSLQVHRTGPTERGFDPKSLAILQGVAHQTSITAENLRLLEARQEEAYVTAALLQVAQVVVTAGNLSEVMDSIVHLLPILVGVEMCVFYGWDGITHQFRPMAAQGSSRKVEEALLSTPYPAGEHHLLDCVYQSGKVQLSPVPDPATPVESWPELTCISMDTFTTSGETPSGDWMMGFPMVVQGQVLGVLLAREENLSPAFWERRMEILNGISQQAALALQNERLKDELVLNERFEREVQLARQIQETFLPDRLPDLPGWEADVRWETARMVGGDFYDMFRLDERRVGMVIADVSDKGVPAALYMTVTRTLVRANVRDYENPAEVLHEVNRLLFSESPESMFITAVYAILSLDSGELLYANAGHNLPLLYRARSGEVEELPKGGTALGVLERVDLRNHTLALQPGDALVLFTDGTTDTLGPDGDSFGDSRLREAIRRLGNHPVKEMLGALDAELTHFRKEVPPIDDVTILAVRRMT